MKHLFTYYLLLIIISCLPLVGIFSTSELLHTHDGSAHLARIPAYYKAIRDGEFPVRWAGDLNFGYGMPLFDFMYQVPYAIATFLITIGFHLVTAYKITLAASYLLAGITMFAFAYEFFEDKRKALWVTIFYQFAPFRLIELLVRGALGEVYTYAFFPLVLFGMIKLWKRPTYGNFFLTVFASALLILSHNALSLVFFGICVGFLLLFGFTKKNVLLSGCALGMGLMMTSFYWLPAIFEHKYTYGDLFMQNLYLQHFPPMQNFFIPNFFNLPALQTKGISVQLGLFHSITILLAIIMLFMKKTKRIISTKLVVASLCFLVILFYFMQPISIGFWAHSALLRQFQFSWRLLGIVAFFTSMLSICYFIFPFMKKQWMYITVLCLVIGSTAFYWIPPLGYNKVDESYYWNFPLTSTYFGETDVIWSAGPAKSYPKQRVEFISGGGAISHFSKKTQTQRFIVSANEQSQLVDHIEYFPGWRAYVNSHNVPIQFQDPNWRGQLIFSVPKGISSVVVSFGETPLRFITDILSVIAVIILLLLWLFRNHFFYENKKN